MEELLGYPLDLALAWLRDHGIHAEIRNAGAPIGRKGPVQQRVVQVLDGCLVVSSFPAGEPSLSCDAGSQ